MKRRGIRPENKHRDLKINEMGRVWVKNPIRVNFNEARASPHLSLKRAFVSHAKGTCLIKIWRMGWIRRRSCTLRSFAPRRARDNNVFDYRGLPNTQTLRLSDLDWVHCNRSWINVMSLVFWGVGYQRGLLDSCEKSVELPRLHTCWIVYAFFNIVFL